MLIPFVKILRENSKLSISIFLFNKINWKWPPSTVPSSKHWHNYSLKFASDEITGGASDVLERHWQLTELHISNRFGTQQHWLDKSKRYNKEFRFNIIQVVFFACQNTKIMTQTIFWPYANRWEIYISAITKIWACVKK